VVRHILISKPCAFCWLVMALGLQVAPAPARALEKALVAPKSSAAQKDEPAHSVVPTAIARVTVDEAAVLSDKIVGVRAAPADQQLPQSTAIAPTTERHRPTDSAPRESRSPAAAPRGDHDAPPMRTVAAPAIASAPAATPQPKQISEALSPAAKPTTPKKEPKSVAPLLSQFFPTPRSATAQPTAVSPPNHQRSTLIDKLGPTNREEPELPNDPELGVIQVSEVQRDDELGVIQLRNPLQDPELGILELQQISPPPRRNPFLFLSIYGTASSSDNVFLVEDPIQGRFGDNFIRSGVSITAFPALGPRTNLLVSARSNLLRYEAQSNSSYDELRFQTGVRHQFSERVYGQLSLSYQLLFDEGYTDQFFSNTGVEVTIGRRDPLTPRLTLDSYYQGQVFFSDPERFSNVLNSVGAYLGYRISSQWDTGVGYRLTVSDFTQQSRHETYQRITGQLRYSITPSVRLSMFGGLSYGRSSASRITFDDTFFGISFDATVSIF